MISEQLNKYDLILASGSPRRQEFFKRLGWPFRIATKAVEEIYDERLNGAEITDFLAKKKADAFGGLMADQILVTSDTIVWFNQRALEKPVDLADAKRMLQTLSGQMHEVFTSVCITTKDTQKVVNDMTKVWFKTLSEDEIDYYVVQKSALDKAGSYGIQDWLGYIGVERIEGCFFNVMGLPTRLVYHELKTLITKPNHYKTNP